jgi:hypothetical protein
MELFTVTSDVEANAVVVERAIIKVKTRKICL